MRIVYIQYTNPGGYPPLEHSSRILANAGWKVLFLGTRSFGANSLTIPHHPNLTVRQLSFQASGIRQKLHYLRYFVWVLSWVITWRPRWVYASDPLSAPVALVVSWIPWLKVIYHEHDSPCDRATAGPDKLIMRTRLALATRAQFCVLPNETRTGQFRRETGARNVLTVWNCPRREEVAAARPVDGHDDVWVQYHGSIVPDRLPLAVLTALARLPDNVKLRVIGYETVGSSGYLHILRRQARQLGVLNRVEVLGPMPRAELLQHSQRADIGLALMPSDAVDLNMRAMVGASNKVFDYLACGLALMVTKSPDWDATFVQSGFAVSCTPDDAGSIECAVRSLTENRHRMREMGERGRQKILTEWNYDTHFAKVYELLTPESSALVKSQLVFKGLE